MKIDVDDDVEEDDAEEWHIDADAVPRRGAVCSPGAIIKKRR